jgi:hypothetical protein
LHYGKVAQSLRRRYAVSLIITKLSDRLACVSNPTPQVQILQKQSFVRFLFRKRQRDQPALASCQRLDLVAVCVVRSFAVLKTPS